ncbi:MAG TPA: glycosyltransferase family 9 protein, partial [Blastocatellia bacterium]|nr:glycosyltransferase family 9 protein [Blastocatellia bacterium]
ALPALRELRRIFANSRITLAARPWVAGLFQGEGLADNIIPVLDGDGFLDRAANFVNDARRLRSERFDYAVLLPNSFGSALTARAGGAKRIAGYPTDGRRLLLNHIVSFEADHKNLHQVRYYLNIASEIEQKLAGASNVDFEHCEPRLHVSEELRQRAEFLIEQFSIERACDDRGAAGPRKQATPQAFRDEDESQSPGRQPILAINPGATNSTAKRWLAERFAETADRMCKSKGFRTVIVGADGDREVAEQVAALMRTTAVVLAGKTSIEELKGVLSCAQILISNDTGAAHVSAALGVPTVVVFGPTEHVSTRPLSERTAVVRHDVECSPCMLRKCPIDHRCMTGVQVEDVCRSAVQLLDRGERWQ